MNKLEKFFTSIVIIFPSGSLRVESLSSNSRTSVPKEKKIDARYDVKLKAKLKNLKL